MLALRNSPSNRASRGKPSSPPLPARWESFRRDAEQRRQAGEEVPHCTPVAEGHDTVGVLARSADGRLAGGCSTSGLAFKMPGRVGDSPIVGHGLYVDPGVGAAVGTGHGELIMRICGTFLIVEEMRRGATPLAAITTALERIARDCQPLPQQQAAFLAVSTDGRWGAGSLRPGFQAALRTAFLDSLLPPHVILLKDA